MITHDTLTEFLRRRIKADYEHRRRLARGVRSHQSEHVTRTWGSIYAEIARIDAEEAKALAALDAEHVQWIAPEQPPKKPGPKADPRNVAATECALAAIEGGVPQKRAIMDAAEKHGVKPETIRTRIRRGFN
jgi:hypothetical protein